MTLERKGNSSPDDVTRVHFVDVGGSPAAQKTVWPTLYPHVHAVVWVSDATKAARWAEEKVRLQTCLENKYLAGKPVLLLVNKQDTGLPHYSPMRMHEEVVGLCASPSLLRVEGCIADAGQNYHILDSSIEVGLAWLLGVVQKQAATLAARVQADVQAVTEEEKEEEKKEEEKNEEEKKEEE